MRVLLVRPPRIKQAISNAEIMFCEPIGLEGVYAVLSPAHEVRILDLMVPGEHLDLELQRFQPDVVGFTSLCIDVNGVLRLARETRRLRPDAVTLAGGTQANLAPEAFYDDNIDHVFQFTTADNLLQLCAALDSGEPPPRLPGIHSRAHGFEPTAPPGRNALLTPDRSSTRRYRRHYNYFGFSPAALLQTSLGCSAHCHFCLRWRIEGPREEDRPIAEVFDEVKQIDEPSIMIFDNDFIHDGARLNAFCQRLEDDRIQKNWICYASVHSILAHREALERFARNGLRAVLVGYESFTDDELRGYAKTARVADNAEASRLLKRIGVACWASFIGHPDWSRDDFRALRRSIRQLRPETTTLVPLTPFPNLPLYRSYSDRLLFKKEEYESWSFGKVSVQPSQMSLRRYYLEILKTNLYVNLWLNSLPYMVRQFGPSMVAKITVGSLKLFFTYVGLALKSREPERVGGVEDDGLDAQTDRGDTPG